MSNRRRITDGIHESKRGLRTPELAEIYAAAPDVPGYGGGKWALYGLCCWWSSIPSGGRTASGLPCCPHCGSPLFQAPLGDFLRNAEDKHPPADLAAFVLAHRAPCHRTWAEYLEAAS